MALGAGVGRLSSQYRSQRGAQFDSQDDAGHEVADLGDVHACGESGQRLHQRGTQPDVAEHPSPFGGECTIRVFGDIGKCGLESETGSNGDRQEVQGLR